MVALAAARTAHGIGPVGLVGTRSRRLGGDHRLSADSARRQSPSAALGRAQAATVDNAGIDLPRRRTLVSACGPDCHAHAHRAGLASRTPCCFAFPRSGTGDGSFGTAQWVVRPGSRPGAVGVRLNRRHTSPFPAVLASPPALCTSGAAPLQENAGRPRRRSGTSDDLPGTISLSLRQHLDSRPAQLTDAPTENVR